MDEIIPKSGDKDVGLKAYSIVMDIISDKSDLGLHDKWMRWYELGKNKHWKFKSDRVPQVSINMLHKHRQRIINQLTDNNPTFNVRCVGMIPENQASGVNKLLKASEYWWGETEQQDKLANTIYNGETYGVTIEKMTFNPDLELGIGEVETVLVDPYHFGLWPVKTMEVQKALACVHFQPMIVREVKRKWPEAKDVKADSSVLKELGEDRREVSSKDISSSSGMMVKISNEIKSVFGFSTDQAGDDAEETMVCEVWVKDFTKNDLGENMYSGNIRRITICSCGKCVLEDVSNPSVPEDMAPEQSSLLYLYDKFPFISAHACEDTSTFWSSSDFEQLEDLNLELNKSISQFKLGKDKASRFKMVNPRTSGVSNSELDNQAGPVRPKTSMHGIEWITPPPLQPDLMASITLFRDMFFMISDAFVSDQAQKGRDVISAKAIGQLIEQSTISLRGKIRSYSKLIRERGRMYLSLLMAYYTEDRWIMFDEDGQEKTEPINGRDLVLPVKLSVVTGSTMPVSKIQQREEAISTAQMGFIDPEALLEKLEWSNRKEIVNRMKAGPIGEVLNKLSAVLPPQVMQQVAQIAQMPTKDFHAAMKKGEIPPIQMPPAQGPQGPDPIQQQGIQLEFGEKQANIGKSQAEAQKTVVQSEEIKAKIALIQAQIITEHVKQQVAMKGIGFDEQKLIMERARVIKDLEDSTRSAVQKDKELEIKRSSEAMKNGPFRDRGIASDNKEVFE